MAIKAKDKWACSYCGKQFKRSMDADLCRDNHDLVYVMLSKNDLNRLVQFIFLRDEELLTPTLVKSLRFYLKGNDKNDLSPVPEDYGKL